MEDKIIVIGAGAAGIGAALELGNQGVPFEIFEAADRVGGRAYTDRVSLPVAWDQGCHWMHCADANPLVEWADRTKTKYSRDDRIEHFKLWADGDWLNPAELETAANQTTKAFEAIYTAAEKGLDVPISDILPTGSRWTKGANYIVSLMASEDPERVSAAAYGDYLDTEVNWPVTGGYGNLVTAMARDLPVRLNTPVSGLNEVAQGVEITTAAGKITAKGAIVTASTNVLTSGAIRFGSTQASDFVEMLADIPCGAYEKVAVSLKSMPSGLDGKMFAMVDPGGDHAPVDFQISSDGGPMLIAHMAGSVARDLAVAGPDAMKDFAAERLNMAFGSGIKAQITGMAVTSWVTNPLIRGGYSYSKPGSASLRRILITAETGRIMFAGEAFSKQWQATAHGAYQSGRDVAARLAALIVRAESQRN